MLDIKRLISRFADSCEIVEKSTEKLAPFIKEATPGSVLLVVITFNRPDLLRPQIEKLKCNLENSFHLIVADNSNISSLSADIKKIVLERNYTYLRLNTKTIFGPSFSHGLALNSTVKFLLSQLVFSDITVGFLDHDIFLNKKRYIDCSHNKVIARIIGQKVRYFWPGLFFIQSSELSKPEMNFLPSHTLFRNSRDTGIDLSLSLNNPTDLDCVKVINADGDDWTELIDGAWLHLVNASNWRSGAHKII